MSAASMRRIFRRRSKPRSRRQCGASSMTDSLFPRASNCLRLIAALSWPAPEAETGLRSTWSDAIRKKVGHYAKRTGRNPRGPGQTGDHQSIGRAEISQTASVGSQGPQDSEPTPRPNAEAAVGEERVRSHRGDRSTWRPPPRTRRHDVAAAGCAGEFRLRCRRSRRTRHRVVAGRGLFRSRISHRRPRRVEGSGRVGSDVPQRFDSRLRQVTTVDCGRPHRSERPLRRS